MYCAHGPAGRDRSPVRRSGANAASRHGGYSHPTSCPHENPDALGHWPWPRAPSIAFRAGQGTQRFSRSAVSHREAGFFSAGRSAFIGSRAVRCLLPPAAPGPCSEASPLSHAGSAAPSCSAAQVECASPSRTTTCETGCALARGSPVRGACPESTSNPRRAQLETAKLLLPHAPN